MIGTVPCALAVVGMFLVMLVGCIDLVLACPGGLLEAAALVVVSLAVLPVAGLLAVWLGIRRACRTAEDVRR